MNTIYTDTAYAKDSNRAWCKFNDSEVSFISETDVLVRKKMHTVHVQIIIKMHYYTSNSMSNFNTADTIKLYYRLLYYVLEA